MKIEEIIRIIETEVSNVVQNSVIHQMGILLHAMPSGDENLRGYPG